MIFLGRAFFELFGLCVYEVLRDLIFLGRAFFELFFLCFYEVLPAMNFFRACVF